MGSFSGSSIIIAYAVFHLMFNGVKSYFVHGKKTLVSETFKSYSKFTYKIICQETENR